MKRSVLKVSRWVSVLAVAGMLWLPAQVLALSVNTSDIVDGAVTTPKIADGAISSSKIAAGAVTNSSLADGSVTDSKLGVGAVTSSKIADSAIITGNIASGAVTDDKISGTISTSKLNVGTSAGTVAAGDHNHDATYQKKAEKVLIVAKSGGDYTSLTSAISAAATMSPYVTIKVMPGLYENESAVVLNSKNNISIIGESKDSVIVKNFYLDLSSSNNINISGITFDSSGSDLLRIDGSTDVTISSSVFKGGNTYGAPIQVGAYVGSNNVIFKDNVVEAPVSYAIACSNGSTATFESNVVKGGTFYITSNNNEVRVTRNTFITETSQLSIFITAANNIIISGNTIKNTGYYGIRLQDANNIQIDNNNVSLCQSGIYTERSTGVIKNNRVVGNAVSDMYIQQGAMKVFYNIADAIYNVSGGGTYRYNVDSNGNDSLIIN